MAPVATIWGPEILLQSSHFVSLKYSICLFVLSVAFIVHLYLQMTHRARSEIKYQQKK